MPVFFAVQLNYRIFVALLPFECLVSHSPITNHLSVSDRVTFVLVRRQKLHYDTVVNDMYKLKLDRHFRDYAIKFARWQHLAVGRDEGFDRPCIASFCNVKCCLFFEYIAMSLYGYLQSCRLRSS